MRSIHIVVALLIRAKAAMRDGMRKGVLWHQGESDTGNEKDAQTYGERLARIGFKITY